MLYHISRSCAKVALGVYFRKIYLCNLEVLPDDKPVIFAANHPTAFIEPSLLAAYLVRPLSFLARGDLYANNLLLRKLYDWHRMTPIFRREDTGYSNLKNNYGTFERCFRVLKKNKTIMIMAEGLTNHEKRLFKVRKGTARIVFGALENVGDLDIYLVPVGVDYTNSDSFRSVAMIRMGEPIHCTDYTELYNENPPKAIKKLTADLESRLKNEVVHIEDKTDDDLVDKLLKLNENNCRPSFFPVVSTDDSLFTAQKNTARAINKMDTETKANVREKAEKYYGKLESNNLTDADLMNRGAFNFGSTVLAILGAIPAMLGYLLNVLPVWIGSAIAGKIAPAIEFRAATSIVFSSFLYILYGIALYATGFAMGYGWKTFALLLIPALGYFYVGYRDFFKRYSGGRKSQKLPPQELDELLKTRGELLAKVA